MLSPIKLRIKYDGEPQIAFYFLFLKYRLLPKKQKHEKKRLSRKEFLSRLFRTEKKKEKKSISKKAATAHKKKKPSASEILEFVRSASGLLKKILNSFFKHSKIKVSEISIIVATEDASRTAIMYGVISQAVSYLLEILSCFTTVKRARKGTIQVLPDFTREASSIKLDLLLQQRPLHILGLLISTLFHIIKNPDILKSKKRKITKKSEE